MTWKLAAVGALAVVAYLLYRQHHPEGGASALDRGDPRGSIAHAAEVLTKGAKEVAEEGKKAILGQTRAHQRESDKKRRVGG
jgi:hypothetical protein